MSANPVLGAGYILIASAFVAASTLCAKQLGIGPNALPAIEITWGRYFFALIGLCTAYVIMRPTFTRPNWSFHFLRVACGTLGVTCMFGAAAHIPLADVTAISFLNPVVAMVLAIPILGERIGPIRWSTAALAVFGAFLLIRPGTASFQPVGLVALAAACLFGLEVIMLKLLAGRESAFQVIFIANILGTLLASFAVLFVWQMPVGNQWFWLAATGLLMVTAQVFYTSALKIGDASFVLPFSYATLLFAALYDFALFSVIPVPLSLFGGVLIVISGVILAWRDNRAKEAARQPLREQKTPV